MTATGLPQRGRTRGKPGRGLTLREATFDDYEQIGALETDHGLAKGKSRDEWGHLWLGNPLYQELRGQWSIGWVLEDAAHRIVGSIGNIPLPYRLGERRLVVAASRSWVAAPSCRGASLLLLDNLLNQPHADLFLTNTAGRASADAIRLYECPPVPVGRWDEAAFWITGHRGFLESYFRRKQVPLPRALSYALAPAVLAQERLRTPVRRRSSVEVTSCPEFDERFDEFWSALCRTTPDVLLADRTRAVLHWHYKHALLHGRLWIGTITEGSRLLAYAVFDRRDVPHVGLTRARLVDFQALSGGTTLLPPLLAWARQRCRAEGIHVLESFGVWLDKGEVIDRLAPYRRKLQAWSFYYRARDPELAERLRDPRSWAPSLFDSDASVVR